MKRLLMSCAVALPLVALAAASAQAEVKTRDKSQVKFEGMLGRMVGMFGGKAAKEGVVATNAVKGNRKATMNDTTGQIVDLAEEKVYELDLKKKTYKVTTFDELRQPAAARRRKRRREARGAEGRGRQGRTRNSRTKPPEVRGRLRRQGDRPEEADRRLRRARGRS